MRAKPAVPHDTGPNQLFLPPSIGLHAVRLIDLTRDAGAQGLIYLAQSHRRAGQLAGAIKGLSPDLEVQILPPWDCLPYDSVLPSREVMGQRMSVLHQMATEPGVPRVLITSPVAVIQRVPPQSLCTREIVSLKVGDVLCRDRLEDFLCRSGYILDDRVDEPGEAALHGQVIDLFPAHSSFPYRVEHDGSAILAIRRYDPVSQRTEDDVNGIDVMPASEAVSNNKDDGDASGRPVTMEERLTDTYDRLETVFDYWPDAAIVMEDEAEERRRHGVEQIVDAYQNGIDLRAKAVQVVKPEQMFILDDEWDSLLDRRRLTIIHAGPESETGSRSVPFFAGSARPVQAFSDFANGQMGEGRKILLLAATGRDLGRLRRRIRTVQENFIAAESWEEVCAGPIQGWFTMQADVRGGFVDDQAGIAVITAYDVLGSRAESEIASQGSVTTSQFIDSDLHIGDVVVHIEHGLGQLEGLETIRVEGQRSEDALRMRYANDALLLVPAAEMDRIWRYGAAGGKVKLDKLKGDGWIARRHKIEYEIEEAAKRLASLADERKTARVEPIVPPARDYERFAARFAYTETPGQARAIEDVLQDLASGHPMDRLVCGDVGFGKTEVALRAAAAVALSGRQVAVIAPTTVLARQHLRTFQARFAGFGIQVAHLSRLTAPAEARSVKKGLADGSIRVVVGTHALSGKGVTFQDLGLIVIDEEQRFGASHKSKLRELGKHCHVLTLTATPIPRTLQTSLVGLQDISIIATPPSRHQPIRTLVKAFDRTVARDALMREKRRGGQSFAVCPRIEDIEPMREQLTALVPELDVIVAHGQMPPAETDEAMVRFADGDGDLLLATNIIESGLDVPRANTILIWRADRFGLAQLHQLRGRVGRGRIRGTAYLLTEPDQVLPQATEKRLRTLEALDRLGAGFAISAQDLDQRGAGSLLGEEQAGHVKLVGTDLYQHMLRRAVRGGTIEDLWSPELNIGLTGMIPDDYVNDPETRINLYARIARLDARDDVEELKSEIEDRFGTIPLLVNNLIDLTELKQLCIRSGIAGIDAGPQAIALRFRSGAVERLAIEQAIALSEGELHWSAERLILARSIDRAEERLESIRDLLDRLA